MARHTYYYGLVQRVLRFLIAEQKTVLCYGVFDDATIPSLEPLSAVCVSQEPTCSYCSGAGHIRCVHVDFKDYVPDQTFDYVILNIALAMTDDMCQLLRNVAHGCERHTRVIIHQENHLWEPFLKWAGL